ncbi:hypothetical protein [Bradyrhizobium sp. 155]|nr:hypothetical protein [Bradyrhizobium sp. 155]
MFWVRTIGENGCGAFAAALDYLATRADAGIYYYSKYERTTYRKL